MDTLDFETFCQRRTTYDASVARTDSVDRFCTSSYWLIPAFEALFPDHDAWIRHAPDLDGWVGLARGHHAQIGHYLQPMEASWGLAAPMTGSDLEGVVSKFGRAVRRDQDDWDMLFLSGVYEDSALFQYLVAEFRRDHVVGVGPTMSRHVASLEGGFDGWFSRRSSKFRSNIRRARRDAGDEGFEMEYISEVGDDDWEETFDRIVAVERNSWKAQDNSGIASGAMNHFYRRMTPMLAGDDALRVSFVTAGDTDIAYCFGGLFGDLYRGLQLSYDSKYKDYSVGNLAQIAMLEGLCDEDVATYDMGQAMDYKSRWAEQKETSVALVIR